MNKPVNAAPALAGIEAAHAAHHQTRLNTCMSIAPNIARMMDDLPYCTTINMQNETHGAAKRRTVPNEQTVGPETTNQTPDHHVSRALSHTSRFATCSPAT